MNTLLTLSALAMFASAALVLSAETKDTRVYEMRIYYAAPGKLDDLNKRFRDHTLRLFEKHGIENIGYWTPIDNTNNALIYVLAHASREAAKKSWADFLADPDWKAAAKASEANGKLISKIESHFMQPTDYSPAIKASKAEPRVFELREYTASAGNLAALDSRFRDHTVALFKKHGMENLAYWHLDARPEEREPQTHLHPRPQNPGSGRGIVRRLPQGPNLDRSARGLGEKSRRFIDRRRHGGCEIHLHEGHGLLADEIGCDFVAGRGRARHSARAEEGTEVNKGNEVLRSLRLLLCLRGRVVAAR